MMLENKKILVAYFSANGVTKFLAEEIADIVQGDLFEIKPQIPYTAADLIWTDRNSRTTIEMHDDSARPAFIGDVEHMDAYDIVFLGFPICGMWHPILLILSLSDMIFPVKLSCLFAPPAAAEWARAM